MEEERKVFYGCILEGEGDGDHDIVFVTDSKSLMTALVGRFPEGKILSAERTKKEVFAFFADEKLEEEVPLMGYDLVIRDRCREIVPPFNEFADERTKRPSKRQIFRPMLPKGRVATNLSAMSARKSQRGKKGLNPRQS